jgi:hypothetical protein
VRNLRISLAAGRATGYADVDFLRLRTAAGVQSGWILRPILSGERPVSVKARFDSRNGRARVDVERVEVSGIPIEGRALELLVDDYLRPTFPDVRIAQWFGLRYNIERFTVAPSGVTVILKM